MSATKNLLDLTDLAQRFDADRQHLRAVAFRLLGSIADADDAVQSAWLKASRADFDSIGDIANLTGWFTTITAHEAFDQLRVRKRRAEQPLADARSNSTGWRPRRQPRRTRMRCWLTRSAAPCWSCWTASHPRSVSRSSCTTFSPCPSMRSATCWTGRRRPRRNWPVGPDRDCTTTRPPNPAASPSTSRSWKPFWRPPAAAISPVCSSCWLPAWCAGSTGCWFLT